MGPPSAIRSRDPLGEDLSLPLRGLAALCADARHHLEHRQSLCERRRHGAAGAAGAFVPASAFPWPQACVCIAQSTRPDLAADRDHRCARQLLPLLDAPPPPRKPIPVETPLLSSPSDQ